MSKNRSFAWNGGQKPRKPSDPFASSVGVTVGGGPLAADGGPAPADRLGPSLLEEAEGLNVSVQRMGERTGPEVIRPTGRVRMSSS